MSTPEFTSRVNVSVSQRLGSGTVEIFCGDQKFHVKQTEALALLRKLAVHFGVPEPRRNQMTNVVDLEARRESLTEEVSRLDVTERKDRERLEAEAVAMGAVVDWDEYGDRRICWPAGTPRMAGKAIDA